MRQLINGSAAPPFSGVTPNGQMIHLNSFLGRPLWLIFYRYPGCPLCNLHLSSIKPHLDKFPNLNWNILCVFPSPSQTFKQGSLGRKFPEVSRISDPKEEIFSLYGVGRDWKSLFRFKVFWDFVRALFKGIFQGRPRGNLDVLPAHFLIDKEGVVVNAYYGKHASDHISWDEVEKFFLVNQVSWIRDQIQLQEQDPR